MARKTEDRTGSDSIVTCSVHDKARAAWRCTECGKGLCQHCAAVDTIQKANVVRCVRCGGVAEVLMVRRSIQSWWNMLPVFLKAIFSGRGVFQLMTIALILRFFELLGWIPLIGWIIYLLFYYGLFAAYMFNVLDNFTGGAEKLRSLGTMSREVHDLFASACRLILAAAIVWVPLLFYIMSGSEHINSIDEVLQFWSDPVLLIIFLVGIAYVPAAFIVAALSDSTLSVLNPLMVLGFIMRAPGQYFKVALFCGALFVGNSLLQYGLLGWLIDSPGRSLLVFLGKLWLFRAITLVLPVMIAMVLGRFIQQNAEAFEFSSGVTPLEPAVPGAMPRGEIPAAGWKKEEQMPALERPEALELESTPNEVLVAAIRTGNDQLALGSYRKVIAAGGEFDLNPEAELLLAKLLDSAGDSLGAVHAFRRAVQKDPGGPMAPKAIFTAARLLIEKVNAQADGHALLEHLVKNYPEHELAARAREKLGVG